MEKIKVNNWQSYLNEDNAMPVFQKFQHPVRLLRRLDETKRTPNPIHWTRYDREYRRKESNAKA